MKLFERLIKRIVGKINGIVLNRAIILLKKQGGYIKFNDVYLNIMTEEFYNWTYKKAYFVWIKERSKKVEKIS